MQTLIYRWLLAMGIGHVVLGMGLLLVGGSTLLDPYLHSLYPAAAEAPTSVTQQELTRTLVRLFGPTVASWGLLYCVLLQLYRRHAHRQIKPALFGALLLWCLLDSGLAVFKGMHLNLAMNLGVALAIGLPLVFLRPVNHAAP